MEHVESTPKIERSEDEMYEAQKIMGFKKPRKVAETATMLRRQICLLKLELAQRKEQIVMLEKTRAIRPEVRPAKRQPLQAPTLQNIHLTRPKPPHSPAKNESVINHMPLRYKC